MPSEKGRCCKGFLMPIATFHKKIGIAHFDFMVTLKSVKVQGDPQSYIWYMGRHKQLPCYLTSFCFFNEFTIAASISLNHVWSQCWLLDHKSLFRWKQSRRELLHPRLSCLWGESVVRSGEGRAVRGRLDLSTNEAATVLAQQKNTCSTITWVSAWSTSWTCHQSGHYTRKKDFLRNQRDVMYFTDGVKKNHCLTLLEIKVVFVSQAVFISDLM